MFKLLPIALIGAAAAAQTQIDLRTQARNVDFSAAASTKPLKTGTALPATCAVGEMFFKTDAPAGANLYGCPVANSWAVEGGLSGQNCWIDAVSQTLRCSDTNGNVYAVVETSTGAVPNQWVSYIDSNGVPHTSQPTAAAVGATADPGSNGVPYRSALGTAAPATADNLSGSFFCRDTGGGNAYSCNLTPPLTSYSAGTTYWFRANAANTGAATINFNSLGPKPIVKQADQSLAPGDIKAGQWVMATYDGANMQMQSQTANAPVSGVSTVFGRAGSVAAQTGDYTSAQVTESGNLYFTNARAWAAFTGSGPVTLNGATGAIGCPTCITAGTAADTDLYGNFPHLSVVRIQGRPMASVTPLDMQYLGWNNAAGQWEPKTAPSALVSSIFGRTGAVGGATGDYTTAQVTESGNLYFTNARTWAALSGAGPIAFNSSTGVFNCPSCITSSSTADTDLSGTFPHLSVVRIQGRPVAATPPADQQYLGWNISANYWEPKTLPNALVASVFGRMGPVAAQAGDYSFAQISGAAGASQLPAVAMRTDQGNTISAGTQNFSGAAHTLPLKSGLTAALPSTCTTAELYFATDAPAGSNVYGCTAANTWAVQGNETVMSGGSLVGNTGTVNFVTGTGLMTVIAAAGSQINVQTAVDTAVVQTQPGEQGGAALLCASGSGSGSAYQCSLNPTLGSYMEGMVLHWIPDVNGAGGATTLNVDTLGMRPMKQADGVSNPGPSDIIAGQLYSLWYDGAAFRLTGGGGAAGSGGLADPGSNGVVYRNGSGTTRPASASEMSGPFACQDAGSTQAYACNLSPPITTYGIGTAYWFHANTANQGPATINFNSLGAKTIKKLANQDLAAADIKAGQWVMLTYDGTYMQMQSQTANPASGGGAVSSVFGRSGAIVSQTGDYTAAQVTNAVDATASYSNPAWITALAYSKLSSAPTLGTAAAHAATDFAASNASTTVNGQSCALGSTCTVADSTKVPTGTVDILRFGICIAAGCGSETTINYIATMGAGSFTECAFNLATAATGSSVIVDVQDGSGTSIFGATKLVATVANGTAVEYQSTFANSPQTYARGSKYKAVILQNDSGGAAQGGTVQCR
jgi:hypothetical protein